MPVSNLDLVDGQIIRKSDGRVLKSLGDLATESLYSLEHSQHITAETTAQIKSNAYSFVAPLLRWKWISPCAR